MAKTLEEKEESRIEELERLAREGDETDKLIAEMGLAEERGKVATANAKTIEMARLEKEASKGIVEDIKALPFEKGGERKLEDMPEMEEQFSAKDLQKLKRHEEDELAKYNAKQDAKQDKFFGELAIKSSSETSEQRERLRKDLEEKHPKATIGQRIQELATLRITSPATDQNVKSAAAIGAALSDFDARMKLNNATSSAKSRRVAGAIPQGQNESIAKVMAGMNGNANLKYFNEVRAKSGSFFANLLNVGSDATPEEERAAQERTIYLARQGNKSALLQVQALSNQYDALAEARKLQGTRDHAAAVKKAETLRTTNAAAQQKYYTMLGEKAVDENGIFQRTLLPDDVLEMMYDKGGSLTLQGAQILAGGGNEVITHNRAIRTQVLGNKSEYESVSNELNNLQGIEGKSFDSMSLKEKISATNPNNIKGLKDKLEIVNGYITATEGEPPESVKNNINFRNDLLKQKSELLSELNGEGTSVIRKGAIKLTLGRLNRNLAKTNTAIKTSYSRMAATTKRINESGETEVELEKSRLLARQKDGQDRMDEFRKLVEPDKEEADRMGVQTDGIGKGGGFFEFAFFDKDPDTGKYTDVKWQFRPWLGTHTQASKGGVPASELKVGVIPDDLKKISNAYVWNDGTGGAVQGFERTQSTAQKKIYAGALKQWQEAYEKPVAPASTAPSTPPPTAPAPPVTPAPVVTVPNQPFYPTPTGAPPAPAPVVPSQPPAQTLLPVAPSQPPMVAPPVSWPTGPAAPTGVSTPAPPISPEEKVIVELEATNIMNDAKADANGNPYAENQEVPFLNALFPDSVRGRTFIFKTDEWGNPYWLLKQE